MGISRRFYGKTMDGKNVDIFTLTNSKGMEAEITNYGAIVVSIKTADYKGNFEDVVLGFDKLEDYFTNEPYFGALIGRVANRIGKASFVLNGREYKLVKNDGENHLHGGDVGFNKVVWQPEIVSENNTESLQLYYRSADGEENYPGNLDVKVTYTLGEDDALKIDYHAVTDKDTIINLTNHSYFNLSGHGSGTILKHRVMINSEKITASDKASIPTGEFINVKGTPMDFTELKAIEEGIFSEYEQIVFAGGYDHNWVLDSEGEQLKKAAEVVDDNSGRVMEVFTTSPGIQLYTGNYLNGTIVGKKGIAYERRTGLCLETQNYPDAINQPNFPSPVLKPGEEYKHTTIYKFSAKEI